MARRSKARSLATAMRQSAVFSAAIENPGDTEAFAAAINTASGGAVGSGGSETVTAASDLPLVGNEVGSFAFVEETNRLYIWNGNGWYSIALINTSPTITGGVNDSYTLQYATPLVISMVAADPEEVALSYSYELISGSPDLATITNTGNLFTVTPTSNYSTQGSFIVAFKASDGINIATKNVTFSLTNQAPSNITGLSSTYTIANSNTQTLTLSSTDPEGQPLTWSYQVISGSLNGSTVSQNNNVFTITSHPTNTGSATIRFSVSDGVNTKTSDSVFTLGQVLPAGVLYQTPGTYTWVCPAGVTSVCAVTVGGGGSGHDGNPGGGGGGLGWRNNISVVPGQSYTVIVGAGGLRNNGSTSGQNGGQSYFIGTSIVRGYGGSGLPDNTGSCPGGGYSVGGVSTDRGGGNGGKSGQRATRGYGGGGGAGGYNFTAGTGGTENNNGLPGNGGGGAGGSASAANAANSAGGGGGVGVYGIGNSGTTSSQGGSGGTNGNEVVISQIILGSYVGGSFGGGAGAAGRFKASKGGGGAVRIIWGDNRAFPSTNVSLASSTGGETTI